MSSVHALDNNNGSTCSLKVTHRRMGLWMYVHINDLLCVGGVFGFFIRAFTDEAREAQTDATSGIQLADGSHMRTALAQISRLQFPHYLGFEPIIRLQSRKIYVIIEGLAVVVGNIGLHLGGKSDKFVVFKSSAHLTH